MGIVAQANTTTSWPMMNVTRTLQGGRPGLAEGTGPSVRLAQGLLRHRLPPSARRRQRARAAGGQGRGVPDGFDIEQWKDFMRGSDGRLAPEFERGPRHPQYLMTAEMMGCPQNRGRLRRLREEHLRADDRRDERNTSVIRGEWCLFNSVGCGVDTPTAAKRAQRRGGAQAETLTAEQEALAVPGACRNPSSPHGARAAASTTGTTSCSPTPWSASPSPTPRCMKDCRLRLLRLRGGRDEAGRLIPPIRPRSFRNPNPAVVRFQPAAWLIAGRIQWAKERCVPWPIGLK